MSDNEGWVNSSYWTSEQECGECSVHCEGGSSWSMLFYGPAMLYMFVGLAVVCEEYFVPSLNALCERIKLPDDIAGATFMAAGASSPELFASLIGVSTGSAVGVGTVVVSPLDHCSACFV